MLSFLLGVLTNFVSDLAKFFFKKLPAIIPRLGSVSKYKRDLAVSLRDMPFIYKDVDLEVLADYVDIEVKYVETSELKPLPTQPSKTPLDKLNQNFKVLFVGSAGMGKSTFFRYCALSVIKKKDVYFLSSIKHKIPIFITLKSVPNFGKSPILNSILTDISFLKYNGLKRLERLTERGKVFFLFDGYDEISFVNSENHIKYELGLLMSEKIGREVDYEYIDEKFLPIYRNILRCTVWLSTREEFLKLNYIETWKNIKIRNVTQTIRGRNEFIAVQMGGLGEKRLVLVKKIFDKYRQKSNRLSEILDEEGFIEEIDTQNDEELITLSERPLFLTILCYLYVTYFSKEEKKEANWLPYLNQLPLECINVLLSDLDKFKVRDIKTDSKRNIFLKRRSDFIEEKKGFLKYFAFNLLLDGVNIFGFDLIKESAKRYFEENYQGEKKDQILKGLNHSRSNNPNFVEQLIFSGVFVIANFNSDNQLYDFPHRRFKEALVIEAIKSESMFDYFLKFVHNRNLSEFILLAFKEYKAGRYRMLAALQNLQDNESYDDLVYANQLILNLLEKNPDFELEPFIIKYIFEGLDNDKPISVYLDLIKKVKNCDSIIEKHILKELGSYVRRSKLYSVNTALELLKVISPEFFENWIDESKLLANEGNLDAIIKKFRITGLIEKKQFNLGTVLKEFSDQNSLLAMSCVRDDGYINDEFLTEIFLRFSASKFIRFFSLLIKNQDSFDVRSVGDEYLNLFTDFESAKDLGAFQSSFEERTRGEIRALNSEKHKFENEKTLIQLTIKKDEEELKKLKKDTGNQLSYSSEIKTKEDSIHNKHNLIVEINNQIAIADKRVVYTESFKAKALEIDLNEWTETKYTIDRHNRNDFGYLRSRSNENNLYYI